MLKLIRLNCPLLVDQLPSGLLRSRRLELQLLPLGLALGLLAVMVGATVGATIDPGDLPTESFAQRCEKIRGLPNPSNGNSRSCDTGSHVNSPTAVAREAAELAAPVQRALSAELETAYQKYAKICDVQNFAADAERLSKGKRWNGNCLRSVKDRVRLARNRWLLDVPTRSLDEGVASRSPTEFGAQGFFDILPSHPELKAEPSKAPLGALLVYKHNSKDCPVPPQTLKQRRNKKRKLTFCEAVHIGHIEIRTANGFGHESFSNKSILENPTFGIYLELSAVLIKPVKLGAEDPKRGCIQRL